MSSIGRFRTQRYLFNRGFDNPSLANYKVVLGDTLTLTPDTLASALTNNVITSQNANLTINVADSSINLLANINATTEVNATWVALVLVDNVSNELLSMVCYENQPVTILASSSKLFTFTFISRIL